MKPREFAGSNFAVLQPPNKVIPVFTDGNECVSCWGLSVLERLKLLWCGEVWLSVGSGITPPSVSLSASPPLVRLKVE